VASAVLIAIVDRDETDSAEAVPATQPPADALASVV
jgi:hypothetical protein